VERSKSQSEIAMSLIRVASSKWFWTITMMSAFLRTFLGGLKSCAATAENRNSAAKKENKSFVRIMAPEPDFRSGTRVSGWSDN